MAAGVVLDTSFLITLADSQRAHHKTARSYWKYFTEQAIPIYISTIVASEFYLRQEIPQDILRACITLPFNWDDAMQAAKLDFPKKEERGGESRVALKDDLKIIAQAIVKNAAWIITDDSGSFFKFAQQLRKKGTAKFRPIKLQDGFDKSLLNEAGQGELGFNPASDESQMEDK